MSLDNVTLNGAPVSEYIDKEVGREIGEVRKREAPRISRHVSTNRNANVSGARTTPGIVIYDAGQRETHVIIAGNLFAWQDKAPYVRSGHSLLGALEYDGKTDTVKCHTCGEWFKSISHHISNKAKSGSSSHSTVRNHRIRHGFRLKTSLATPSSRALRRKAFNPAIMNHRLTRQDILSAPKIKSRSSAERLSFDVDPHSEAANLLGRCRAQRLNTLKQFALQLGRTPMQRELKVFSLNGHNPLCPSSLRKLFRVPVSKIFIQAGIAPRPRGLKLDGTYGRKRIMSSSPEGAQANV